MRILLLVVAVCIALLVTAGLSLASQEKASLATMPLAQQSAEAYSLCRSHSELCAPSADWTPIRAVPIPIVGSEQLWLTPDGQLVISLPAYTQEKGTFKVPVARPPMQDVEIVEVRVGRLHNWSLSIYYIDNAGVVGLDQHQGLYIAPTIDDPATPNVNESSPGNPTGADVLVKQLNRANLAVKSLECRAIEHLVAHGKIPAATCTGKPQ